MGDTVDFEKMTEAERERYLDTPVTRRELLQVMESYMHRDIDPLVDSKVMFLLSAIRFILDASGILKEETFNSAFQTLTDEFTRRFGETEEG